jgi:MFS family permease
MQKQNSDDKCILSFSLVLSAVFMLAIYPVTAYALVRFAMNGGFAAGPALGGILYAHAPWMMFVGGIFTTVLFAGLAYLWLPHGLRTVFGRVSSPKVFLQSWKVALVDLSSHR